MTILVTGSAGHLGEALMRLGRARGLAMRGLDVTPSDWTDVMGDIADPGVMEAAARGASAILHTATLHKPHIATHSRADFARTNVTGTAHVLAAACVNDIDRVVFTSTTSTFGHALRTAPGDPAAWIDETVVPQVKNIYGETKLAAEALCEDAARASGPSVIVLRTSRFFPEPDDDPAKRAAYPGDNARLNELLYRRVDIEDAAEAHFCALSKASEIKFGRYIISTPPPFTADDRAALGRDASKVVTRAFPQATEIYSRLGWRMPDRLDRVYDPARAVRDLGWSPAHTFASGLDQAASGDPIGSAVARRIGIKGYHGAAFRDGLYPV